MRESQNEATRISSEPLKQIKCFRQHMIRTESRTLQGDPFILYKFGSDWDPKVNALQASIQAAQLIYDNSKDKNIKLPLSGGVDSEAMAYSFLRAGVPFEPVIMNFTGNFNEFDTAWAMAFCKKNNLRPLLLELNLEQFYQEEQHLMYAVKYNCRSPQLATHLWILDQVQGNFIFPYNPLPLMQDKYKKLFISCPPGQFLCYENYCTLNDREGINFFFLYTEQQVYSFLFTPLYLDTLFDSKYSHFFSSNSYSIKCELYNQNQIPVERRFNKATGFEQFRKYLNSKNNWNGSDFYDTHFRKPMESIAQDSCLLAVGDFDFKNLYQIWQKN